jgi:hypothetical protein
LSQNLERQSGRSANTSKTNGGYKLNHENNNNGEHNSSFSFYSFKTGPQVNDSKLALKLMNTDYQSGLPDDDDIKL